MSQNVPLVLIRHGESAWNRENRFTGWVDVDLSEKGRREAEQAGATLKREGFEFDAVYTSILKRAIRTMWSVLDQMDRMWLPVTKSWRLNERHYGALQGLDKGETAAKYGDEQVKIWRRSYDTPPPFLDESEALKQAEEPRFRGMNPADLPRGETLKTTLDRFLPLWRDEIAPQIAKGERILIVAHGNSIRALVQHLERLTPEQIMEVNIPTGVPLVYELTSALEVKGKRYLGDPEAVAKAQSAVANQGKAART